MMSEQPRPRLVRSGEVPLTGAADRTHLAAADATHLADAPCEPRGDAIEASGSLYAERFEAPPPPLSPARTNYRRLAAAAAVVTGLGAASAWGYVTLTDRSDTPLVAPSVAAANPAVARGDTVVRAYLEALAAGDVATALAQGPTPGAGSHDLLTAEAYSPARQRAPITDVNVPAQDPTATLIQASYGLGGKRVDIAVPVRRNAAGVWQLVRTTRAVRLDSPNAGQVPLRVNGVTVRPGATIELLPGQYTVGTGRPYIAYPDSDQLTVTEVGDEKALVHQLDPYLTDEGKRALRERARQALATCLASTELAPQGCPFRGKGNVVPGSVQWTRVGPDPVTDAPMALDRDHAEVAVMTLQLDLRLSATTKDGTVSRGNKAGGRVVMRAPITGEAGDPMPLTWQW